MDNPKINVIDRATGEVKPVDPWTAEADFRAGKVGLQPGTTVPVVLDGQVADLPVERLADALGKGVQLAGKQDILTHDANQNQLRAAAEGVVRAGTFGLSDLAAAAGGADMEAMGARAATEAAGMGEAAGNVGQALLAVATGGLSTAAGGGAAKSLGVRALQAALKPVSLVDDLGRAIAGRAESALTGAGLGQVASRAIGMGAGGAVEGAVVGGLQGMSEAALGNPELNAELLLQGAYSGATTGALFGGATGALMGGATAKLAQRKSAPITQTVDELDDQLRREGINVQDKSFLDKASRWLGKIAGGADEDLAVANSRLGQQIYAQGEGAIAQASTKMAATLDDVAKVAKELDDFTASSRSRLVRNEIPEAAGDAAAAKAADVFAGIRNELDGLDLDSEMLGLGSKGGQSVGAKLAAAVNEAEDRIFKAAGVSKTYKAMVEDGVDSLGLPKMSQVEKTRTLEDLAGLYENGKPVAVTVHDALDGLRTVVEQTVKGKSPEVAARLGRAEEFLKGALHDGEVWGDAARIHQLMDSAATKRNELRGYLDKSFRSEGGKIIPESVTSHIRGILSVDTDTSVARLREFAQSNSSLVKALHSVGADTSALRSVQGRLEKFSRSVDSMEKPLRERVGAYNAIQRLARARRQNMAAASNVMSYGLGAAVHAATGLSGAPLGLAASAGFTALTDPARFAVNRARMGAALTRQMEQLNQKVSAFVNGTAGKELGFRGGRLTAQITSGKTYQERAEAFRKRVDEIRQDASPLGQIDRSEALKGLAEAAPNHADALQVKQDLAARMLLSAVPAPLPTPGGLGLRPPTYTDSAMRKFARLDTAIQDPNTIIEQAMKGVVTHEGRQVLHTLYPQLALTIQNQLVQAMDDDRLKMSPERERAIKMLLTPVGQNDTQRIMKLQNVITSQPEAAGGGGPSPKVSPTTDVMSSADQLLSQ